MQEAICPSCKKTFLKEQEICKDCKNQFPSIKKGCRNLIEVISFFLVLILVFGFVTFCQKNEELPKRSVLEKIYKLYS